MSQEFRDENGLLHNEFGPAKINDDGSVGWYYHGLKHRLDGPAVINYDHETWFKFDKRHRIGGPAVISSTIVAWFVDGKLHREDGPAIHFVQENRFEWWLNGRKVTEDMFWDSQKNTEHAGKIFASKFGIDD